MNQIDTPPTVIIHVLFFAHFADLAGVAHEDIGLPAGSKVGDLARLLAARDRRLGDLIGYGRAAVNAEWAASDTPLADGDEVAFMPPMSGG